MKLPRLFDAAPLRRLRLSLGLLLGRRFGVYLAIDLLLLFGSLIDAVSGGGEATDLYVTVFLVPLLILGIPALSNTVALERQAGSLDLALSSAGGNGYFFRRAGAFVSLLALQGILVMTITWFTSEKPFPIFCVLAQVLLVTATTGGAVLFWALRLRSAGGVAVASVLTLGGLARWLFYAPIPDSLNEETGRFVLPLSALGKFGWNSFILLSATTIFVVYSLRRVRRPETILG